MVILCVKTVEPDCHACVSSGVMVFKTHQQILGGGECRHSFLHIKHSGPVIKLSDRKDVLWHKRISFRIKTNFIAALVFRMCRSYMSPNTLSSCRSFPWPATVQSTPVVNHSLPILLSFYEPFLCHVIHKKKTNKVLETYSL